MDENTNKSGIKEIKFKNGILKLKDSFNGRDIVEFLALQGTLGGDTWGFLKCIDDFIKILVEKFTTNDGAIIEHSEILKNIEPNEVMDFFNVMAGEINRISDEVKKKNGEGLKKN